MKIERVSLKSFNDAPDGILYIAESAKNIPFAIKRVYYINNLQNQKAIRGLHAHKKLEQVIFCINGSFSLTLDNGKSKKKIVLKSTSMGVRLRPKIWHVMRNFSKNCALLVLASDYFKVSDYIRDYQEFLKICA